MLTVLSVTLMASCGGVDQSDPRSVADAVIKMYQDGDYAGLASLVDPDDESKIQQFEQIQSYIDERKANGQVKETTKRDYTFDKIIDGMIPTDKMVQYTYYDSEYEGGRTFNFTVRLTQVDGKWYFDRFD